MSKKDYTKIAKVLKTAREKTTDKEVIRHIITELIKVFQQDNIRFDAEKFERAIYDNYNIRQLTESENI